MAHGAPDWWGTEPTATVHPIQDAGELAARLWSPVTFDRRGNVVFMDTFQDGLNKWHLGDLYENAEVHLSVVKALVGAYSARLITPDSDTLFVWIARDFQPTVESKIGAEYSYQIIDSEVDFVVGISHYTGSDEYSYNIKFDTSAGKLYYQASNGDWVEAETGLVAGTAPTCWNTMKLVVDLSAKEYVRAVFNDTTVPLAGLVCPHTTIGSEAALYSHVRGHGDVSQTYTAYVDRVIITQNEP